MDELISLRDSSMQPMDKGPYVLGLTEFLPQPYRVGSLVILILSYTE